MIGVSCGDVTLQQRWRLKLARTGYARNEIIYQHDHVIFLWSRISGNDVMPYRAFTCLLVISADNRALKYSLSIRLTPGVHPF